jgi:iron complex outermembrane recepter protein
MGERPIIAAILGAVLMLATAPACAQRADNNALTQSDDAFGKSISGEQIGIYNADDVRGFSPSEAGNLRIEGLYFDQQANPTDRLIDNTTIHVGISAQGYPFPAPTGIADRALRRAGAKRLASVALNYGPFDGKSAEVDAQIPFDGDRLGLAAGVGVYRERNGFGGTPEFLSIGLVGRFHPSPGIEILPFWSSIKVRSDESQSLIFPATRDASGNAIKPFLPSRLERGRFFGQKWAVFDANLFNYGLVAKADPLGFDVRLGVFRSTFNALKDHNDLLFDTEPDGNVRNRVVIIDRGNRFASTSGELRISRRFDEGPRRHTLVASVRARDQVRRFGGADSRSLGVSRIDVEDFRPEPVSSIGPKTRDEVRQTTFGLGYQGRWRNVGEISLGIQKTRYSKRITDPDPAAIPVPVSRASPILYSATAALYLSKRIALYGGYTTGLEESPVAPNEALNRNEAPPAIRTRQKEAGIRWAITDKASAVIGVFDISKPYFNLDANNNFTQLGQVRNRGVEVSVSGEVVPGLNLLIGNLFLDSVVSGQEVDRGLIGRRPVGATKRHTIIGLDYKLPWVRGLSLDVNFESTSARTANTANTLVIPARGVASLGARYRFKVDRTPTVLRFQVQNVGDTFGWNVFGSGIFTANGARRWLMVLAADI